MRTPYGLKISRPEYSNRGGDTCAFETEIFGLTEMCQKFKMIEVDKLGTQKTITRRNSLCFV